MICLLPEVKIMTLAVRAGSNLKEARMVNRPIDIIRLAHSYHFPALLAHSPIYISDQHRDYAFVGNVVILLLRFSKLVF